MAFYQMNMSIKNKLALMIVIALAVVLSFTHFDEKLDSLPFRLDHAQHNKYELSQSTDEKIDRVNKDVPKITFSSIGKSSPCDSAANVLPVRLTISRDNKIKSFGSYITEDYLFKTLEKRSYDCESVKLYFTLEEGLLVIIPIN